MAFEKEQQLLTTLIQKQFITQQQAMVVWNEFINAARTNNAISLSELLMQKRRLSSSDLQRASQSLSTATSNKQKGLAIGENFNHYRIESLLGRGGMGAVYAAYDHKLNRKVALKIILGSNIEDKIIERFLLEAKAMAQLRHPNIVEIYDVGEHPQNYFTMEYVDGDVFSKEIEQGTLNAKQIAQIMLQCAHAVAEIHKYKIVHRDIKPSNIMLTNKRQVKLMDFGLAKMTDNNLSCTGELLGTPFFMSPEQAGGTKVGKKSDIYSLGASLYMALAKTPPFQGESVYNTLNHILNKDPVSPRLINPDIPVDLESICLKCLEKKPSKRYATAMALAEDLQNFIHNRPVRARPITYWGKLRKWTARNTKIAIISGIAAFVILASIVFTLYSFQRQIIVEKNARLKAINAEKIAVREMERSQLEEKKAHRAKKEAEDARKVAEDALQAAEEARKAAEDAQLAAVKSEEKAQMSAYNANIALANLFLKDNKVLDVENRLESCPENMRGWEWHWLKGENNDEYVSLEQHKSHVVHCTLSADNKRMASLDSKNKLIIWDFTTETPRMVRSITCAKNSLCNTCTFSPDGKQIAVAGKDVFLYDVASGKILTTLKHTIPAKKVVFSVNGKMLIACYLGQDQTSGGNRATRNSKIAVALQQTIVVWDVEKRRKRKSIVAHKSEFLNNINDCDIYKDWLLTAGDDKTVRLWDVKTGKQLQIFKGHEDEVSCCRFASQGKIVSASYDKTIRVWDIKRANATKILDIHKGRVYGFDLMEDGQTIVSVGEDQKLIITDLASEKIKQVFTGHKGVSFSRGQRHLAVISSCAVTKNGQTIITSGNDNTVKLWKASKQNPQTIAKLNSKITTLSFSADNMVITNAPDIAVRLWSRKHNKVKPMFSNFLPSRMSFFNQQGDKILVACSRFLRLFALENKQHLIEFVGLTENVISCAYSPDGTRVAAGCYNDRVHIWNIRTLPKSKGKTPLRCKPSQIIKTGSDVIYCAFNHKNDIATANNVHLKLHDAKTARLRWSLHREKDRFSYCEFSQDGKWLLAAHAREIWLVDVKSGKLLRRFVGHNARVTRCKFINNDQQIISVSRDRSIKIWSLDLEHSDDIVAPLFTLGQNQSAITAMAISPDERLLAIGSQDGQVKIWTNYGK
ncbi:WD40 repeat domain-containing serine/threonine protein kinase [Candidatus Uabimicrobium amorphum]|uniref:non-specific serine/threonine protein kinase n=1 Tax=Uabimicrobium amorphum TaxID=2596890 RepID=A0A5S9F246_UABAM|nr:serine/threonine-protein kinase [Candidatus Uabimicrobium amorphum]BBM83285.1 protein kinase [Candidatus Uabimicrobium amorphum]